MFFSYRFEETVELKDRKKVLDNGKTCMHVQFPETSSDLLLKKQEPEEMKGPAHFGTGPDTVVSSAPSIFHLENAEADGLQGGMFESILDAGEAGFKTQNILRIMPPPGDQDYWFFAGCKRYQYGIAGFICVIRF